MRFFLALFSVGFITILSGSPVGNPAFPRIIKEGFFIEDDYPFNVRLGYEGDFVADARLSQEQEGSGRVDDFSQSANAAVITLNFKRRIDAYTVLGASQFNADWRFEFMENNGFAVHRAQMGTLAQFLWGFGARAIVYETETLTLSGGARYSFCEAEPVWLTIDAISQDVTGTNCRWDEWQIDLDFAFQIDFFTPYVGIKYAVVHNWIGAFSVPISGSDSGVNHFETRNPVGFVIGCTISNEKYFMLNAEVRLVGESAVTISGDLRF